MATEVIDELYERHIKPLSAKLRLELLARVAQDLAGEEKQEKLNIMDLHGLGSETWRGTDAQEYVNKLRDEWDQ